MSLKRGMKFINQNNEKQEYYKITVSENNKRGKVFSKCFVFMCIIFTFIEIVSLKISKIHIIVYSIIAIISLFYLIHLKNISGLNTKSYNFIKRVENINVTYILFNLLGITTLAYLDKEFYVQAFAFLLNITICSAIFNLNNKEVGITYFSCIALFIGDLYLTSNLAILFNPVMKYILVFCFLSWFSSRVLFLNFKRYNKSRILLKQTNYRLSNEIKKNKFINNTLTGVNKELMGMSMMDELTQIPNRRSLNLFIESFFYNCFNAEIEFSIIMIDIDNFKLYNDTYGHNSGDEVLKKVAGEINYIAKKNMDFIARFGGEEFIYISDKCDRNEICLLAEKIRIAVMNLQITHELNTPYKIVTISLGISTTNARNKEDVLRCTKTADEGLYICKRNGRNCSKFVSSEN